MLPAKPDRSPMTPPPRAITQSSRLKLYLNNFSIILLVKFMFLDFSPAVKVKRYFSLVFKEDKIE